MDQHGWKPKSCSLQAAAVARIEIRESPLGGLVAAGGHARRSLAASGMACIALGNFFGLGLVSFKLSQSQPNQRPSLSFGLFAIHDSRRETPQGAKQSRGMQYEVLVAASRSARVYFGINRITPHFTCHSCLTSCKSVLRGSRTEPCTRASECWGTTESESRRAAEFRVCRLLLILFCYSNAAMLP